METELAKDGIQEFYFLNKLLRAVSNCFVTKEAGLVIADNEHVKSASSNRPLEPTVIP